MHRFTRIAIMMAIVSGCTHTIELESTDPVDFYQSSEDPVPGVWMIAVDESITEFSTEVLLSARTCQGSSYRFEPGAATSSSIYETLENVFEETYRGGAASVQEHQSAGAVDVRLVGFHGELACEDGLPGIVGDCTGLAQLIFEVHVNDRDEGQLLSFTATTTKGAVGRQPAFSCADIGDFFVDAYRAALEESLERIAGRLSNSEQLRAAGSR